MNKLLEVLEYIFQVRWVYSKVVSWVVSKQEVLELAEYNRTVVRNRMRDGYMDIINSRRAWRSSFINTPLGYTPAMYGGVFGTETFKPPKPLVKLSINDCPRKLKRYNEVISRDLLKVYKPNPNTMSRVDSFYSTYGSISISNQFKEKIAKAQHLRDNWISSRGLQSLLDTPIELVVEDEVAPSFKLRVIIERITSLLWSVKGSEDSWGKAPLRNASVSGILESNKIAEGRPKLAKDLVKIHKRCTELLNEPGYVSYAESIASFAIDKVLEDLQDYQSRKGGKSKRTFHITSDSVEMLGASEACGWSSCFRIEGEYHQGAIGLARTPSALMAYELLENQDGGVISNKLSRAWLLLNDEATVLKVPTVYTSTAGHEGIRKALATAIADRLWLDRPNSKGSKLEISHDGNFYEDGGSVRSKEAEGRGSLFVEAGMTPDGDDEHGGYFSGQRCDCCDDSVDRDELQWVESRDEYVCDGCISEYYFYCDECNEYQNDDDHNNVDGRSVCQHCVDHSGEYEECYVSGEISHKDNLYYIENEGVYVQEEYAYLCEYSNFYYLEDDITYIDGYGMVGHDQLDVFFERNPEYREGEDDV